MDIFVTPNFPVGGMENWGLIVFHISTLTMSPQVRQTSPYEPSSSSQAYNMENSDSDSDGLSRADRRGKHRMLAIDRMAEQYRVEKAIIHELVHQWFGNLVTMNDWSQLWLSEGFATYFVFDFLNTDHPHLTEHEYFMRLIELLQKQTSSQASALLVSPGRVDELHRMFDGLHLYTKGAVLVKMLKDLVGSQAFRAGVTRYLKQNAYKSVDTGALWSSLPSTVDHGIESVKLAEVVSPWLYNKGVPEVIVQRGYDTHSIQIVQQKSDQNQHIVYLKDDYDFGEADKASDSSEIKREKREFRTHENTLIRKKMRSAEARSDVPLSESNERSDYKALKGREAPRSSKRVHQNKKNNHRHKSERRKKDDLPKNEKGMRKKFSVFSDHGKNQKLKKEDEERGLHSSLEGIDVLMMDNNEATHRNRNRESRAKNSQTVREEAEKSIWPIPFSYSFGSVKNPNGRTLRQLWFRNKTAKFVDTGIHRGMYLLVT
jgi:aminopeptidase N